MPDQLRSARAGRSLDCELVDWESVLDGVLPMFELEFEPLSVVLMPLDIPLLELFVELDVELSVVPLGLVADWLFIPAEGLGAV